MKSASRFALLCLVAAALAPAAASAASPPKDLYEDNCSACHQVTGKGIKGAFPTLAASPLVNGPPAPMVTTVLNGRAGMPAFKDDINDADLASIISYVRTSWGNKGKPVTASEIAAIRAKAKAAQSARGLQAH
jgi:cytochrome c6